MRELRASKRWNGPEVWLVLMLLSSAPGGAEERPKPRSTPIVIPDEAIQGVLVAGPEAPASPDPARLKAQARAAAGQEVKLHGHIERRLGDSRVVVLGREVDISWVEVDGGNSSQLVPNTLVEVQGRGQVDGSVEASLVKILPPRDAVVEAKIRDGTREFTKEYWKEYKRLEDAEVNAYVQRVGQGLIPPFLPKDEREFSFWVVEDPTPNAFALPDGTIVVHTGLVARMENEAQLATVLAHELAHVTDRHYIRSLKHSTKQKLLSIGSMIAQIALTMSGDASNARAAKGVGLMSSALLSGYSRSFEDEADAVGLRYLYLAGYDVEQAPSVWRTFRRFYGDQSPVDNYFYGSHSTAKQREASLQFEIDRSYAPSGLLGGRIGMLEFMRSMAPAIRRNGELCEKRGWTDWAETDLRRALNADPDDPVTYVSLGEFLLRQKGDGALPDAVAAFRRAVEVAPEDAESRRALGLALRRAGVEREAATHLRRALELDPEASWAASVRATLRRLDANG